MNVMNNKTIYIVDDDEDDRMLVREALEDVIGPAKIIEAIDGRNLLDLLLQRKQSSELELILLDINMPRMNGLETLAHIRANHEVEHIPIIMFSTSSDQKLINSAYKIGVNAFVKKPVSIADYSYMAESVNVCFLNSYPSSNHEIPVAKTSRTRSVLVVEDHSDHWELMKFALKQSMPQATVIRLNDSESTIKFLGTGWQQTSSPPQLVLMDLYLPTRQKGLDLLEKIRLLLSEHGLSTVPVIIFSNSDHQDDIKACYQRQANAYMVKPFDLNDSISYFKTLNQFIWDNYTAPENSKP